MCEDGDESEPEIFEIRETEENSNHNSQGSSDLKVCNRDGDEDKCDDSISEENENAKKICENERKRKLSHTEIESKKLKTSDEILENHINENNENSRKENIKSDELDHLDKEDESEEDDSEDDVSNESRNMGSDSDEKGEGIGVIDEELTSIHDKSAEGDKLKVRTYT